MRFEIDPCFFGACATRHSFPISFIISVRFYFLKWLGTKFVPIKTCTGLCRWCFKGSCRPNFSGFGSKTYGRLSVMVQWLCSVKRLFDLPPSAFTPPPKIKSSVLHFVPKDLGKAAPSFKTMEALLAAAFGQSAKWFWVPSAYMAEIEQVGRPTYARRRCSGCGLCDACTAREALKSQIKPIQSTAKDFSQISRSDWRPARL